MEDRRIGMREDRRDEISMNEGKRKGRRKGGKE